MKSHSNQAAIAIVVLLALIVVPVASEAQHQVFLQTPNTIPNYCQESGCWCGAATAQMILEGYPGGVDHVFTQTHIWNRIQVHLNDAGVNWCTDPDGLRATLMELGGDPGVNWVIHTDPNAQSLMWDAAYWMTRRRYPVATLVYGFAHWVVIVGVETDVDPTQNSTVNLQFIEIDDPSNPPCPTATSGGVKTLMTGANWYANYWYSPGNIAASKWNGNYVAVIEPPDTSGRVLAPEIATKGELIGDTVAVQRARKAVEELAVHKRERYAVLGNTDPMAPLVCNAERNGYYIVPYGFEGNDVADAAVLVNAYTGDFLEVGVFQHPVRYLPAAEAGTLALRYLCWCDARARTRLIFRPSEHTTSRFLPVWEVKLEKKRWLFWKDTRTLYVTQSGEILTKLIPRPLGD